jgi:hypothetical protein
VKKIDFITYLSLLITIFCFVSCRSDYEKMLAQEQVKGIKNDVFLESIAFGMPQKAFMDTCWAMNRRGILSHGTELPTTTRLDVSADFSSKTYMNFFPEFKDGVISEFFAIFVYNDWAPWNKELTQEKLLSETKAYWMKKFGGNAFVEVKSSNAEEKKIWAKVDGNRQILVFPFKEQKVKSLITDLTRKK